MTADKHPLGDRELDAILNAARRETPDPPASLMAAVLSDAADVAARRRALPPVPSRRSAGDGWMASLLGGIGGWQGAATVAASGLAGLWIGYAGLSGLPLVGDLGYQVELLLNGGSELDLIASFEDFTLDG